MGGLRIRLGRSLSPVDLPLTRGAVALAGRRLAFAVSTAVQRAALVVRGRSLTLTPTGVAFTSNFGTPDQNPLDEGVWQQHAEPYETVMQKKAASWSPFPRGAMGTQDTSSGQAPYSPYNDSAAHIGGMGTNYNVKATVAKKSGLSSSPNRELELLLRWTTDNAPYTAPFNGSTSKTHGYEINMHHNGLYGSLNWFKTTITQIDISNLPTPQTGDIFEAQVTTQAVTGYPVIELWWTSSAGQSGFPAGVRTRMQLAGSNSYVDSSSSRYLTGDPGIGAFYHADEGALPDDIFFSSVTITPL